ncbi:MAG TPA: hypothetical protein VI455_08430 [Terriglobia bacterium]
MYPIDLTRIVLLGLALVLNPGTLSAGAGPSTDSPAYITVTVVVTEADTGKPINQAQLTLVFQTPKKKDNALSRSKTLAYSAKTNAEGRCKFLLVPEGTVKLLVTENRHQTFGKEFAVSKENSTLEVKLKPPQPLL